MNHTNRKSFLESWRSIPAERLSWLWLAAGAVLLPFTGWQTVLPIAGWLAPVFLLRFMRTTRRPGIGRSLIFAAYAAGVLIGSRGLPFSLPGLLGNVLLKAGVWTLPYLADRLLARHLEGWRKSLVFPMAFVIADWVLALLPVASSGSPAYSQAGNLALVQIISVTGMWGVTFLLSWCAAIVNQLWERGFAGRTMRAELGVFAGVLAAVLLFGALRLTFAAPASRTVEAATVTADGNPTEAATSTIDWLTFDGSNDAQRLALRPKLEPTVDAMLARTQTALNGGAEVVAWQESSAWVVDEDKPAVIERAAALAAAHGAWLQISLEDFTHTPGRRCLRNESILIGPDGRVMWTYDKSYLVPYDEAFATIAGTGRLPVVDTGMGRFSTAICYDTCFPALLRQAGEANVDVLFAPTNDVPQLAGSALDMAAYRAIENGFTMIRPTGKGVSAIIDREGRVLARQDHATDKTGIMIAALPLGSVRTIYARVGDAFVYFCAAGLASLAGWVLFRRRKPAEDLKQQAA